MKIEDITSLFKEKDFRATPQRIAVYDYVYEHRTHPDVLAVYEKAPPPWPGGTRRYGPPRPRFPR